MIQLLQLLELEMKLKIYLYQQILCLKYAQLIYLDKTSFNYLHFHNKN